MILKSVALAGVCLLVVSAAPPLRAQGGCASAPDAAVQCFVGNAVRTNLVTVQYGMTMAQFKAYGVSVSKIVQEQPTALAVVGLASAVADALPPTNANGSANQAAQTAAIDSIVDAGIADNFLILPAETSSQDLKWFSLDLVNVMNTNNGILLSPGTFLRVIDSYVVTATVGGTVNWTQANSGIATMITNFASAGLLKLPATITTAQAIQFAQSLAQISSAYKTATGRATL
jgi:sorbitol-specific phosphotransferase system component IIA